LRTPCSKAPSAFTSWIIGSTDSSQGANTSAERWRNGILAVAGLGAVGHGGEGLFVVGEFFEHIAHAHIQQAQLPGQVVAVTDVEGVLDVTGQTLQVAQVGFDFQAQAKPVLLAKIGEEVVDLRVELETVRALGDRYQDIQANPHVQ